MSAQKDWGQTSSQRPLTPEQIILWLEGIRAMMTEIWKQNPELRKEWEARNR